MPAPWETREIGRRLLGAWDGEGCVFVVFKSFEVYKELEKLNGPSVCRWLPSSTPAGDGNSDDDDDARSTSTIQTDTASPAIGVICLGAPQFLYEKTKAGLPTCFLFGRKSAERRVDAVLGRGRKTSLSRVHFALGIKSDAWAVRNMCDFETVVNRDTPLGPGSPGFALRPDQGNLIQVADIDFEVYCRDPRVAATYLTDNPSFPPTLPSDGTDPSSASSLTTADAAQAVNIPLDLASRRYVFPHEELESRTRVRKFRAMDAWSCTRYAAKQYPKSQENALRDHMTLLEPVPARAPFMREEILHHDPDALYLLTRYREDAYTLGEVSYLATTQVARRILRTLLRTVALLHRFNVVHNDICLSTVFVVGTLDSDSGHDDILLSGYSEASTDMARAKNDCYQVFQTVRDFLGRVVAPKCWTGDAQLDHLWQHLVESGKDAWPYTPEEICRLADIGLSAKMEEPRTISVSKAFNFKHTSEHDVSYLAAEDVKEYLSKDAVRCAGKPPSISQVRGLTQKAFAALNPCIREGRITVEDYGYFREHMNERHNNYNLGLRLFMSLPNKYYIRKPIQFTLTFPVPYLSRYGLINLEYLRNLASAGFNPDILMPLLQHCFEVRGFPEARGVYISITHLDVIAERLGLRVEDDYDLDRADTSLDEYTYQDWYLLAPNPMSKIFPVKRTTDQVLTCFTPPTFTPLRTFLEDYFESKTYLDSQVVHDPEKLFVADSTEPLPHSCGGSVEAASNDSQVLRFRRSNLPKPSLLLETKEKRRAEETDAWIQEQEQVRRLRRRGTGKGNRADITPTEFVPRATTL